MDNNAVIILSGGMDSVTTLAVAKDKGFTCYALSFNYGQKSISELNAASYYSKKYNCVEHKVFDIDFKNSRSGVSLIIADKNNRSKGYGSLALNILIKYALKRLKIKNLYCNISNQNLKIVEDWVDKSDNFKFMCEDKNIRSSTSITVLIKDEWFKNIMKKIKEGY